MIISYMIKIPSKTRIQNTSRFCPRGQSKTSRVKTPPDPPEPVYNVYVKLAELQSDWGVPNREVEEIS